MPHQKLVALVGEEEAARILGMAVQSLRNRRSQCRPPVYIKIGRSVRYDPEDLQAFKDQNRVNNAN